MDQATTCPYCNERPLGARKNSRTCGDAECQRRHKLAKLDNDEHRARMRENMRAKRAAGIETERMEDRTCESCGGRYRIEPRRSQRFCSHKCHASSLDMADLSRRARALVERRCDGCGEAFTGTRQRRFCSQVCQYVSRFGATCAVAWSECGECGSRFAHDARRMRAMCGGSCKDAAFYRKKRRPWRAAAMVVHVRDGFTCWLCGEGTSTKWSKSDPLSPTLDHIVPRSMGGDDSLDNLATAHWVCNSVRGNAVELEPFDLAEVMARTRWATAP